MFAEPPLKLARNNEQRRKCGFYWGNGASLLLLLCSCNGFVDDAGSRCDYDVAMKPLSPPDSHHLHAAQGWVELGNHAEANEELEQIAPQLRAHPDVLEVRWHIYSHVNKWDACVDSQFL